MIMLLGLLLAVLFSSFHSVSAAAQADVWMLTLLANNDPNGSCQAAAASLGQEIQEKFNAAVPGFTTYFPDTAAGRFLRSVHRDLATIRFCNRTYCSKPANWDACLWYGCSCTCGGRRDLQVSSSASDNSKILAAKRELDEMLRLKSIELGCDLGLTMQKTKG